MPPLPGIPQLMTILMQFITALQIHDNLRNYFAPSLKL